MNFPAVVFLSVFLQFLFVKMQVTKGIKQRCWELLAPVLNLAKLPVSSVLGLSQVLRPQPFGMWCLALSFLLPWHQHI